MKTVKDLDIKAVYFHNDTIFYLPDDPTLQGITVKLDKKKKAIIQSWIMEAIKK